MGWWGKVLGGAFGFMLGGPLGALLGAALGHQFDAGLGGADQGPGFSRRERVQTAFFTATFSVMGHLAKADGRVTRDELGVATAVMDRMALGPELRRVAQRLFSEGKAPEFPLDEVLDQLLRECRGNRNLLRVFVEIQLHAAYADTRLHPAEQRLLQHVCARLGIPPRELRHLEEMVRAELHYRHAAQAPGQSLEDAFAILGVPPEATDAEVKRAYRRLMSEHHPDKLVARGLPEEMVRVATEKSQDITRAYERIREARRSAAD